MNTAQLLQDAVKSQKVRAFDVYALGPFMVWAALASKRGLGKWPRRMLFASGIFTIIYNLDNYRKVMKIEEEV